MAQPTHLIGLIPEQPSRHGGRLGRHLHFDERSRNFRVPLPRGAAIQTRTWVRTVKAFDQGDLGSCTGNGAVGVVCTEPYRQPGVRYSEALARRVYSQDTKDDSIVGVWPPKDTGSTVLGAMKALRDLKLAKGYHWCFGLDDVLKTLATLGPVEVGVSWYEGFDKPDKGGAGEDRRNRAGRPCLRTAWSGCGEEAGVGHQLLGDRLGAPGTLRIFLEGPRPAPS